MKFDRSEGLQEESTAEVKEDFGTPPSPEKHYEALADISVYGMSLQGSSHVERCQPCQDYSDFRFIPEAGLLISAISDGVGSCALSHWGSYTVVTTVLNVLETELKAELQTKKFTEIEGKTIGAILRKAFLESKDAVEDLADHLTQPLPNFYSTLTAAIYDGSILYYGHVGDDGIVVQLENGTYQLVTTRHKGEEANSVNPLQAGSPDQLWQFGRVSEPVVGFLMSTDGVLDQYVANKQRNNRIFYPFLENALYSMAGQEGKSGEKIVQEAFEGMRFMLDQPEYRSKVTDDITVLAAVNTKRLQNAVHPAFSVEDWKAEEEEYRREIQKKLYTGEPVGQSRPAKPQTGKKADSWQDQRAGRQTDQRQNQRTGRHADQRQDPGTDRQTDQRQDQRAGRQTDQRQDQRAGRQTDQRQDQRTGRHTDPWQDPRAGRQTDQGRDQRAGRHADQGRDQRTGRGERRNDKDQGGVIDVFYVSAKKTLDSLAEFLWEPLEEPKMCYCPKCGRRYEMTRGNSYRFCPHCGSKTRPLDGDQFW